MFKVGDKVRSIISNWHLSKDTIYTITTVTNPCVVELITDTGKLERCHSSCFEPVPSQMSHKEIKEYIRQKIEDSYNNKRVVTGAVAYTELLKDCFGCKVNFIAVKQVITYNAILEDL